jgi:hypothetical protein
LIIRLGQHPIILGKTWLNTHGVLLDMLHDKLSFRPDRCDYNILIYFEPKQPPLKQPLPPIMQILKRLCPISEVLKESVPLTLTLTLISTKKARKPKKKRKKSKGARTIEKSLDESKLIFIAMIGAAVYRSLT